MQKIQPMSLYSRRMGDMGDDATDNAQRLLDTIVSDAKNVQGKHQQLINNMANWEQRDPGRLDTDDDLRNAFDDSLTTIRDEFVTRSLPLLGVTYPYQISTTDPAGAIVLAVRDDISNTIALLESKQSQAAANKAAQEVLATQRAIPLIGSGKPSLPTVVIPKIDIPWYVWAGGGLVALLALNSMFGKK